MLGIYLEKKKKKKKGKEEDREPPYVLRPNKIPRAYAAFSALRGKQGFGWLRMENLDTRARSGMKRNT